MVVVSIFAKGVRKPPDSRCETHLHTPDPKADSYDGQRYRVVRLRKSQRSGPRPQEQVPE